MEAFLPSFHFVPMLEKQTMCGPKRRVHMEENGK